MTQTSVSDPLVDLVDAIEEHTHRQQELIECVRVLRAFLVPAWTASETDQRDPRLLASPPPLHLAPPPVQAAPPPPPPLLFAPPPVQTAPQVQAAPPPPPPLLFAPPPVQAAPPVQAPPPVQVAQESEALDNATDSPPQLLLRALKRDYDYFTELDEKLARLSLDLTTKDGDDVDGWPEATSN
jgi:hypothetical protein